MAVNPLRDGPPDAPPDPRPNKHIAQALAILVLLVAVAVAWQYFGRSRTDVTPGGTSVPEAAGPSPGAPATGRTPPGQS